MHVIKYMRLLNMQDVRWGVMYVQLVALHDLSKGGQYRQMVLLQTLDGLIHTGGFFEPVFGVWADRETF